MKRGASAPRSQPLPAALPLTSAQTERWLRAYRGHARLYARGFFLPMIPLAFGTIDCLSDWKEAIDTNCFSPSQGELEVDLSDASSVAQPTPPEPITVAGVEVFW